MRKRRPGGDPGLEHVFSKLPTATGFRKTEILHFLEAFLPPLSARGLISRPRLSPCSSLPLSRGVVSEIPSIVCELASASTSSIHFPCVPHHCLFPPFRCESTFGGQNNRFCRRPGHALKALILTPLSVMPSGYSPSSSDCFFDGRWLPLRSPHPTLA